VPLDEELARVVSVVREAVKLGRADLHRHLQARGDAPGARLGADIVNDIWALRQPGAREAVAHHPQCGICLMHMHREPQTMQALPMAGDVMPEVLGFLATRCNFCARWESIRRASCWTPAWVSARPWHRTFALLARQRELLSGGLPLLGWSRKSSLGAGHGPRDGRRTIVRPASRRRCWRWTAARHVVRVHDVRDTVAAMKVYGAP
jgi:dihydropteroate synthase